MTKLLSVNETAYRLLISRTLLWRLRQREDFPAPVRLGQRRIAFNADAIDAWLAAQSAPLANNGEA